MAKDARVFLAGVYHVPFMLGSDFPVKDAPDVFVIHLDDQGSFTWAHSVRAGSSDYPSAVAVDSNDKRWMAMVLDGLPDVDGTPVGDMPCTAQGINVGLFAWDDLGMLQVARCFGDMGDQQPTEIAADDAGNLFVVGYFDGSMRLGNKDLAAEDASPDAFVVKINGAGDPVWAKQFYGSSGDARALGVGVAQDGVVHVMGTVRGDLIDPDTATPISTDKCGGCEQLFFLTLAP